jgi:putative methyltransferase
MKRVYFFQVQDFFGRSIFLPYASGCLWSYAITNSEIASTFELGEFYFEKTPLTDHLDNMIDPDVVFFSCYGWNTQYHLAMAKLVKEKWPQALTVFGGPNIDQSRDWHEQHPYIDLSIWGEGEHVVQEVLLARIHNQDFSQISGVAQLKNDQWHQVPAAARNYDYDTYPSPYLTGLFDNILKRYSYNFSVVFETNRGCPYQCTFCDIGKSYFNKVRQFTLERILAEIDWFSDNKIEYVDITDSNFGILPRDLEIAKYIKQKHDETGWPKKINGTWAKNNPDRVFDMSLILDHVNRAGITLSLQSSDEIVLKNIKRKNVANTRLREIIEQYNKHNVITYHDFIMGLPGESFASWKNGLLEIVDINSEAWINGIPAEVYVNAEFMEPDYVNRFDIKMRKLPIGNYWINSQTRSDIPVEYIDYVISTATMSEADYHESFLFKVFLSTMHAQGWFRHVAQSAAKLENSQLSDVYESFWNWLRHDSGFISTVMNNVLLDVQLLFSGQGQWGRRIFGPNDVNWDYDASMCIEFEKNRSLFFDDVRRFSKQNYPNLDIDDAIDYNDLQVKSFFESYPRQKGRWRAENLEQYDSWQEHCVQVYWYGRRLRKWRLSVTQLDSV